MKFIFAFLLMTLAPQIVFADAVIFSGNDVKALKQNLDLNGTVKVLSGSVIPSVTATSAPKGSIYLSTNTGQTYYKTDAGSTTSWLPYLSSAGSVTTTSVSATNYSILTTDLLIYADPAGANRTLTLPTAVGVLGKRYTIKNTSLTTFNIIIATTSAQTLDGKPYTIFMAPGQWIEVTSDNANWQITGQYLNGRTIVSTSSASPATNVYGDVANMILPPGIWRLSGLGMASRGGGGTLTELIIGITITPGNSGTGLTDGANYFRTFSANTDFISGSVPDVIVYNNTAVGITHYLKGRTITTVAVAPIAGTLTATQLSL